MDGTIALNNTAFQGMVKTKSTKKEVLKRIKEKLENAKLQLIYTELEEEGIPFERKYSTVKELTADLKLQLSVLDYNKISERVKKIESSLEQMVKELENNSISAFTKFMTSDLTKTVAKSLGISLAGRAALILAPTIATKALVGAGLAGYGLYRMIKSRKEIVEINETNELNNILMDLETTKENDKFIDTRFSEEIQEVIRSFLRTNGITFDDTGYRSLRQAIYALNNEQKRSLCELLNTQLAKGIEIDQRIKSARRKLNVVATTASTIGVGTMLGTQMAGFVNAIDPALTAGVLNGTLLGAWIQNITGKAWYANLAKGLGLIGSEVLANVPVIGTAVQKVFAAENLAAFSTIGAAGGLAVGAGLGLVSAVERIHTNKKTKAITEAFLKLDAEKYAKVDEVEFTKIQEKLNEPQSIVESVIVDIVLGYLRDNDIKYEGNPQTVQSLKVTISKLPNDQKKIVTDLMNKIYDSMDNDPEFVKGLKKAGKISIGLFTAGLAVMSVYDIIKGGSFLPEVSQKVFPKNNIHTPVEIPEGLDNELDLNLRKDAKIYSKGQKIHGEFTKNPEKYLTEQTPEYDRLHGATIIREDGSPSGQYRGTAILNTGTTEVAVNNVAGEGTAIDWILDKLGIVNHELPTVGNVSEIADKLHELTPNELYNFYRYFATIQNDGTPLYEGIKEVLGYKSMLMKATTVITEQENLAKLNNIVNNIADKVSKGVIPLTVGLEVLGLAQKKDSTEEYSIPEQGKGLKKNLGSEYNEDD